MLLVGYVLGPLTVSSCGGRAVKEHEGTPAGNAGHAFSEGAAGAIASGGVGVAGQPEGGAASDVARGGSSSGAGNGGGVATMEPCAGPLRFADPDAEELLREQIGQPQKTLYADDFADVTTLDWVPHGQSGPCPSAPDCPTPDPPRSDGWVTSLAGVECLPHVQAITIDAWFVTDFSPLSSLRYLTTVNIYFSRRAQFSPLPQLRQLQVWNSDSDLAALPAMPNLGSLSAHFVDLSAKNALAPLRSMTTLRNLALVNSAITDVSGLETLTELVTLDLSRNNIGDLSPLLQTSAFGFGRSIDIRDNPITCDDPSVAALLERKVQIEPCGL